MRRSTAASIRRVPGRLPAGRISVLYGRYDPVATERRIDEWASRG
jgi:hypothetical protein